MVKTTISEKYPQHKFIGEETYSTGQESILDDQPTWIVDPIDGTQFLHCRGLKARDYEFYPWHSVCCDIDWLYCQPSTYHRRRPKSLHGTALHSNLLSGLLPHYSILRPLLTDFQIQTSTLPLPAPLPPLQRHSNRVRLRSSRPQLPTQTHNLFKPLLRLRGHGPRSPRIWFRRTQFVFRGKRLYRCLLGGRMLGVGCLRWVGNIKGGGGLFG